MKSGYPKLIFWGLALWLSLQALQHFNAVRHHPYPIEYGEGVNLLWSQRASQGEFLYPQIHQDSLPQLHNPYPPLFPLLSSALEMAGADAHAFSAGRHLSLFGLFLSLSAMFALIRRRTTLGTAFLACLLFTLSPMILRFTPMMRVDGLALGFSLQALNALDKQKLKSAAFLAALAICTKPSFVSAAFTVAITVLPSQDFKKISRTAVCGLSPMLMLLAWMSLSSGNHWMQHLFSLQALPLDLSSLFSWFSRFGGQHAPLLVLGFFSYRQAEGPLKVYAPLLLFPFLFTAGITGSQENYLMELWAAACILSACAFPVFKEKFPRALWLFLLLQLGLFFPVAPAPVFTRTYGQEIPAGQNTFLTPTENDVEIGKQISAELSTFPAPVLSADFGFLLPLHLPPAYQPFQFEHLVEANKWSANTLHQAITNTPFSAVLLKGAAEDAADPTFTPETQHLIHQHYVLHRVLGPWHLYRKK
ncbi:hypothetical protein P0Y35_11415 [Kiritimatiellaeota bacterium B1221]|nr:hypothetical protein [Kiritimatiellaeota bacterium B1221]